MLTALVPSWEWLLLVRGINGAFTAATWFRVEAINRRFSSSWKGWRSKWVHMACQMVGRTSDRSLEDQSMAAVSYGLMSWKVLDPIFCRSRHRRNLYLLDNIGNQREESRTLGKMKDNDNTKQTKIPGPFKVLLFCAFVTG